MPGQPGLPAGRACGSICSSLACTYIRARKDMYLARNEARAQGPGNMCLILGMQGCMCLMLRVQGCRGMGKQAQMVWISLVGFWGIGASPCCSASCASVLVAGQAVQPPQLLAELRHAIWCRALGLIKCRSLCWVCRVSFHLLCLQAAAIACTQDMREPDTLCDAGVMSEWTFTFPLGYGLAGLWIGIVIGVTATGVQVQHQFQHAWWEAGFEP